MDEIITIQISKFLTDEYVRQIAQKQWRTDAPQWVNRSRQYIFDEIMNDNDCFGIVATAFDGNVIGRIHFVRNESDPRLWYYGDLFVVPEYRRKGIARKMLDILVAEIREKGDVSVTLEATEMGRPLYEKYGFVALPDEMELPEER